MYKVLACLVSAGASANALYGAFCLGPECLRSRAAWSISVCVYARVMIQGITICVMDLCMWMETMNFSGCCGLYIIYVDCREPV